MGFYRQKVCPINIKVPPKEQLPVIQIDISKVVLSTAAPTQPNPDELKTQYERPHGCHLSVGALVWHVKESN